MDEKGTIYALKCTCSPECRGVVRYVGQTILPLNRRLQRHTHRSNKLPVGDWVHCHGSRWIVCEPIEENVPRKELDARERYWIDAYGTFMGDRTGGLNLTRGGTQPQTDEEKALLRERNPLRGKLDWSKVREIRNAHQNTDTTHHDLAAAYGITVSTLNQVIRNKTWVDDGYEYKPRKRGDFQRLQSSVLTGSQVEHIRASGKEPQQLADEFSVGLNTIRRVLKNETWYDPDYTPRDFPQRSPNSKITLPMARSIRAEYSKGELTYGGVADKYGVSRSAAADIITNRTFKEPN